MFVYEKPKNKLNIKIDTHGQLPDTEPDVTIYKEDDKTTVLVDGKEIGSGGGSSDDMWVTRSFTTYSNSTVSYIGYGAFAMHSTLTSVDFPVCESIDDEAFYACHSLSYINFPLCKSLRDGFYDCPLTEASFPVCETLGPGGFGCCYSLTTADFPVCTTIEYNAFMYCHSLASISFPKCTTIGSSAFRSCSSLTSIDFPSCTTVYESAFEKCISLTTASFPVCENIGEKAFISCYNLVSLYLTSVSSVPTLSYNVFASTPIGGYSTSAGQYGSVYVPASLYNSFLTAPNWSSISARIVSV